jgi:hypothetical protein
MALLIRCKELNGIQPLDSPPTLLEILSFATNHYATGMQLVVVCNYKFSII